MTTDSWRLSALLREAERNVLSWRSRMVVLIALAVLVGAGSAVFSTYEARSLNAQIEALRTQGRGVVVYTSLDSTNPVQISRASCEGLARIPGVERAGSVDYGFQGEGATQSVFDAVTRDVPQIGPDTQLLRVSTTLLPKLRDHQTLTGSAIARAQGSTRILVEGTSVETTTLESQPAGLSVNSALILPLDAGTVATDKCIVVLDARTTAASAMDSLGSRLRTSGGEMTRAEELNSPIDPVTIFQGRATRFLPLLLAAVGALIAGVLNLLRSSELAAYRMSGTSARSLGVMLLFEQLLVCGLGAVSATAALWVLRNDLVSFASSLSWAVAGFCLWVVIAGILSVPVLLRRPNRLAKDR